MLDNKKQNIKKAFQKLYNLKLEISNNLKEYSIDISLDIKKDKLKDNNILLDQQVELNLISYIYLIQTSYSMLKNKVEQNKNENIMPYIDIIKSINSTKIIKKGQLNEASTKVSLNAIMILLDTNKYDHSLIFLATKNMKNWF